MEHDGPDGAGRGGTDLDRANRCTPDTTRAGSGPRPPTCGRQPSGRTRRNRWLLAGVATGFVGLQLVLVGTGYAVGPAEAGYLSQVNPAVPDFGWGGQRAWGVPLLSAPVALLDAPLVGIRLYLVALSGIGLYLAYRTWLTLRDTPAVPVAAAIFGGSYVTVAHGGQAVPSYYAALGAIAATALFLRCRERDPGRAGVASRWSPPAGLAAAVGFTALVRPSDSIWLIAALIAVWLVAGPRRPRTVGALVVGLLLGWSPWIVEAFLRFGGPLARLYSAAGPIGARPNPVGTGIDGIRQAIDGSCTAIGGGTVIGIVASIWWAAAAAFILLGIAATARLRRATEPVTALVAGASLAFPYLFLLPYGAPRFVLPAAALLALPAAYGVLAPTGFPTGRLRRCGAIFAVLVLLAHVSLHAVVLRRNIPDYLANRQTSTALAALLRSSDVRPPCLIVGPLAPAVAYQLRCDAQPAPRRYLAEEPALISRTRMAGTPVVVVAGRQPPAFSYLARWRPIPAKTGIPSGWRIYLSDAGAVTGN